jgi:chloramphenicol 3-O-phosphotransferase
LLVMGPVSSGKTSLGRAFQAMASEPWLLWEADRCQPRFPSERFPDHDAVATGRSLGRANLQVVGSYVGAGFKVFAELDFAGVDERGAAHTTLGTGALKVVVLCDRSLIERRTVARPEHRDIAWALRHYDNVQWNDIDADIRLRSDERTSQDLARDLIAYVHDREGQA